MTDKRRKVRNDPMCGTSEQPTPQLLLADGQSFIQRVYIATVTKAFSSMRRGITPAAAMVRMTLTPIAFSPRSLI